jgi:hypothetical protein
LCAEGELARVGFMIPDDARAFVTSLEADGLVPEGVLPGFLDYLRTEDGVEVHRDRRTGQEVHVGRTKARRTEAP